MVMMEEPQQDPVALVKAVQQLAKEQDGAADGFAAAVQRLWEAVVDITQRGASEHDELCKHATDIWDIAVEIHNTGRDVAAQVEAQLRHTAGLLVGLQSPLSPANKANSARWLVKAAMCWLRADKQQHADRCLSDALSNAEPLEHAAQGTISDPTALQSRDQYVEALVQLHAGRAVVFAHAQHKLLCQQSMDTLLELVDRGHLPDHATAASTFLAVQMCCHHAVRMLTPAGDAGGTDMAIILLEKAAMLLPAISMDEDNAHTLQDIAAATATLQAEVHNLLLFLHLENSADACALKQLLDRTSSTMHHETVALYLHTRALLRTGQLHEAQTATLELLSAEHTAATGEAHTAQPHSESELRVVLAHDAMMHLLRCALQRTDNSQADSSLALLQPHMDLLLTCVLPTNPCLAVDAVAVLLQPTSDVHADTAPCAERLAIAAAGQLAEQATLSNTADAQRIRALLWNRGVACFNAHLHQRASMLYRATHAWDGDDARTSIDRALQHVEDALQCVAQPDDMLVTQLLQYKVLLMRSDPAAAVEVMQAMVSNPSCTTDMLKVCCHEALQSDKPDVARQALQLLLDALQQGMQQDDNAPGPNTSVYSCAVVLQNLLKFVTAADHDPTTLADTVRYMQRIVELVQQHGVDCVCGVEQGGSREALTWFASTAWNAAKAAADTPEHMALASQLFEHAGTLFGAHTELDTALRSHEKMAFLLAGALALEQLQQQPTAGNEEHTTEALARVQTLLKSSRAAAAKHTPMQADGALEYCMLLEFETAVMSSDTTAQLSTIHAMEQLAGVHTQTLLRCASALTKHRSMNHTVLAAAYNAAMAVELQLVEPRTAVAAAIVRHQAEHAVDDAELLSIMQRADTLAQQASTQQPYPAEELQWLVCTCWNRGAQHAQFGRFEQGHALMQAALLLMHHLPAVVWQQRRAELQAAAEAAHMSAKAIKA